MQVDIDTGDYVLHKPSGECWIVACVQGNDLSWCGWPEGMARLIDCELIEKATPEYKEQLLHELANMNYPDHRSRYAKYRLDPRGRRE